MQQQQSAFVIQVDCYHPNKSCRINVCHDDTIEQLKKKIQQTKAFNWINFADYKLILDNNMELNDNGATIESYKIRRSSTLTLTEIINVKHYPKMFEG